MSGAVQDTTAALLERVREVLRTYPGSQRSFAERIGLDATKLSKSLSGTRRLTAGELTRIADAGNVTVNWLINGSDEVETVAAAPQRSAVLARTGDAREAGRHPQILDAAWHLIAERGYHAVRISDVAKACGISAATIHYHFPDRDDLLTEALRHSVRQAFDRQVAELHSIEDAHERLLRLVELGVTLYPEGRAQCAEAAAGTMACGVTGFPDYYFYVEAPSGARIEVARGPGPATSGFGHVHLIQGDDTNIYATVTDGAYASGAIDMGDSNRAQATAIAKVSTDFPYERYASN